MEGYEISERRSHPDDARTDILNLLLSARDEGGESLTDLELRDELMTLLVTGHETTATALTWALYWIHKLPPVRKKLLTELQALEGLPDPSAVFRLPVFTLWRGRPALHWHGVRPVRDEIGDWGRFVVL
jgi:cytochrome P450 family 110